MIRLGVLGSTRGTNLSALAEAIAAGRVDASIELVVSNKEHAGILQRAQQHGLPAAFVNPVKSNREEFDNEIARLFAAADVELIVLIGYMRILSGAFVAQWAGRMINVHPSLLPAYGGMMDLQVHQAVLDAGDGETGCTVHYVTENVDAGPVIVQKRCKVLPGDTPESLKARVQALEAEALIESLRCFVPTKTDKPV